MEHYAHFQHAHTKNHLGQTQISGEALLPFSKLLSPSKESSRKTLIKLRCSLGLSRGHMAALLGVRKDHLRRWEKGTRSPSASAQKLVWMLDSLYNQPKKLRDAFSIATWGKV